MPQLVEFTAIESTPDLPTLLRQEAQGGTASTRVRRLFADALAQFERLASPRGLVSAVSIQDFAEIYRGEGLNAPETPLGEIYPRAQRLALFAATSGDALSEEIGALFARGDPALGYALDVIASAATSRLADILAERFQSLQRDRNALGPDGCVLPYSPGYCGWHVSGQRRLFEALHPGTIGIELGASFLMRPLKSVSGVLVAGPPVLHRFKPTYPFCADCTTRECRPRMASVLRGKR